MRNKNLIKSILWENTQLSFLDQPKLPTETIFEKQRSIEQVWDSKKT